MRSGEFGGHKTYIRKVELNIMSPEYTRRASAGTL